MKKFFAILLVLLLPVLCFASYSDYYTARAEAKKAVAAGDIELAVKMFLAAEAEADVLAAIPETELPWATYAEWQRNNAANALIESFKLNTNWVDTMEEIKQIPNGPERLKIADKLKETAMPHLPALLKALEILNKRKFIKAEVMAKAKSNKEFCIWVIGWVKQTVRQRSF